MRWLIVSTNDRPHLPDTSHPHGSGWNIGDVFARIGTEQVIREVDPSATFDLLNMDSHASITTEREFDRCVLAGRPAFWANCEREPLWAHVLGGWPGRDKRKIAALCVGDCYALPRDDAHLRARLAELRAKTWGASIRFTFDTNDAQQGVCPAAWVLLDREEKPTRKLCNFMTMGGHYTDLGPNEADLWWSLETHIAPRLQWCGFEFIAHSKQEAEWAKKLHWHEDRIIYADTIAPYLDAYASASRYFGNRMHGATVLAGRAARSMAVGYDSRLGMVRTAQCEARRPSELSLRDVIAFAESEPGPFEESRVRMIRNERRRAVEWMREFSQ